MYILSIIGLVLVVLFVECSMWGIENSLAVLVDPPSLTLLLISWRHFVWHLGGRDRQGCGKGNVRRKRWNYL